MHWILLRFWSEANCLSFVFSTLIRHWNNYPQTIQVFKKKKKRGNTDISAVVRRHIRLSVAVGGPSILTSWNSVIFSFFVQDLSPLKQLENFHLTFLSSISVSVVPLWLWGLFWSLSERYTADWNEKDAICYLGRVAYCLKAVKMNYDGVFPWCYLRKK